ncbi:MAG: polysaccharide export protein [Sphingomonadales bacterium]|nr:polysaccharide export protein [Sphingomonadales bacterium]
MDFFPTRRAAALVACALMLVAGCVGPHPTLPAAQEAYKAIPATDVTAPLDYLIGPLDVLHVSVFREPDLSIDKSVVDSDGMIQVPLLGSVKAAGMTSTQLSHQLESMFSQRFLKDPSVNVSITESSRRRVTVDGAVVQPGVYEMPGRISLIDAVALAKGLGPTSKAQQVVVIRRYEGKRIGGVFDLTRIRAGLDPDPEVVAGDQVIVGTSGLKAVYRDLIASAALLALVFRRY